MRLSPKTQFRLRMGLACVVAWQTGRAIGDQLVGIRQLVKWACEPLQELKATADAVAPGTNKFPTWCRACGTHLEHDEALWLDSYVPGGPVCGHCAELLHLHEPHGEETPTSERANGDD